MTPRTFTGCLPSYFGMIKSPLWWRTVPARGTCGRSPPPSGRSSPSEPHPLPTSRAQKSRKGTWEENVWQNPIESKVSVLPVILRGKNPWRRGKFKYISLSLIRQTERHLHRDGVLLEPDPRPQTGAAGHHEGHQPDLVQGLQLTEISRLSDHWRWRRWRGFDAAATAVSACREVERPSAGRIWQLTEHRKHDGGLFLGKFHQNHDWRSRRSGEIYFIFGSKMGDLIVIFSLSLSYLDSNPFEQRQWPLDKLPQRRRKIAASSELPGNIATRGSAQPPLVLWSGELGRSGADVQRVDVQDQTAAAVAWSEWVNKNPSIERPFSRFSSSCLLFFLSFLCRNY